MYEFNTIIERRGTHSTKWDQHDQPDMIVFGLADMDFRASPAIIKALQKRVDHGVFGYTFATDELFPVIASMLYSQYGWKIEADWVIWLPSLVSGLNVACRTVGQEGDDVITTKPAYPQFFTATEHFNRTLTKVPLIESRGHWTLDFDKLKQSITPRSKLFLLCNPHNPVGRVWNYEELRELAIICKEKDITICSDEIYCGLVLDQDKRHIPIATISPEIAERTITLMSPSKSFNLSGLGFGFAVIVDSHLRTQFCRAMAGIVPPVNAMAYAAALAAYRDSHDWHKSLLSYLRTNRDTVEHIVGNIQGLNTFHVEGTFLSWIDARETGLKDPASFILDAGVKLLDGRLFGCPGFLRLNFACPRSVLEEGLHRLERALAQFSGDVAGL